MADMFEEVGLHVEIGVSVKKRKSENQNVICSFFLLFPMVVKPYGPSGFPFQLIDSWTCPVVSMKHELKEIILYCQLTSVGRHLLYVPAKRLMCTAFLLFPHSWNCLHSLPFSHQQALFAPFVVSCSTLGTRLPLLLSRAL